MKIKLFVLLFALILLLSTQVSAQLCCVPPYPAIPSDPSQGTGIQIPPEGLSCTEAGYFNDYIQVSDCHDEEGQLNIPLEQNCCCNTNTNTVVDFGASEQNAQLFDTYEYYCTNFQNYYQAVPPESNGECICPNGGSTGGDTPQGVYHVTGTVYLNDTAILLPGITVNAQEAGIDVTTNNEGVYDLGEQPGVPNGPNTFVTITPSGYSMDIEGTDMLMECDDYVQEVQLSGTSDYEVEINFNLNCTITGPVCQPDWQMTSWSECIAYGDQYIKTRDVWDENDCGTNYQEPISILTQNTQGEESQYFDCPTGGPSSGNCNDGTLNDEEQCDQDPETETYRYRQFPSGEEGWNPPECSVFGFTSDGVVSCTENCGYDYSACGNVCDVCDGSEETCGCPNCEDTPICENNCDNFSVIFLPDFEVGSSKNVLDTYPEDNSIPLNGLFYTEGNTDVEIQWEIANQEQHCSDQILGYRVEVCEEDENTPGYCKPFTREYFTANQNQNNIILPNILNENKPVLCYNICTLLYNGSEECVYAGHSEEGDEPLACIATGNKACYEPHEPGYNCEYDTLSEQDQPTGCNKIELTSGENSLWVTNHTLTIITPDERKCSEDEQCVETPYDLDADLLGATCKKAGQCDVCNGLFGVFGSHKLNSVYGEEETSINCDAFNYVLGQGLENEEYIGLCYQDKAIQSPFKFYDTCTEVTSCYDYKTAQTCGQDSCFKFTNENDTGDLVNGCEWTYTNEALGVGVCAPILEEEQECIRCDDESPLGFCTEELCQAHGNCYFKEEQHHDIDLSTGKEEGLFDKDPLKLIKHEEGPFISTCMHKRDMACLFYDTPNDCTGGVGATIDVNYNEEGERISGTNEQTQYSEDYFGFGDCVWVNTEKDQGCIKNSDNHIEENPTSSNTLDDCLEDNPNNKNLECFQDTTPPMTNITLREGVEQEQYLGHEGEYLPVYGLGELTELQLTVTDDVSTNYDIETKVLLTPYGCTTCLGYPMYNLESDYVAGGNAYGELNPDQSQEYTLSFYSIDKAKNLEEVQTTYIYIDTTGPQLVNNEIYDEVTSFNIYGDYYLSNLSIEFAITEPAFCTGELTESMNPNQTIGGLVVSTLGEEFSAEYTYLEDGEYLYSIHCYDDYANDLFAEKTITIDGDVSITNPQPRAELFSNPQDITLSIESAAPATCKYDPEPRTYEESRNTFSGAGGMQHTSSFSETESGLYIYYTSCEFMDGTITEQKPSDAITFTLDQLPPETTLYAKDPEVSSSDYEEYNHAQAAWYYNREFKITCTDYNNEIPLEQYGCQKIQYCFGPLVDLNTFTPSDCVTELYATNEEETEATFETTHEESSGMHIYYRAIDNGNNEETFKRANMKLRDITITEPQITIT